MTPALEIKDLRKVYGTGTEALKGVSLTVPTGDFYALLGPNGAGKTTIIGIATGLVNKTSGSVKVFGHDIDQEPELAKLHVGLVGQEINFNPFEKPLDVVVNQGGYYGVPRSVAIPRAKKLLQDLGLGDKMNQNGLTLSGGMKRRLMIARALIHEPKFLILDEPTNHLDLKTVLALENFLKDYEGTLVLVSHDRELVRNVVDRTYELKNGTISKGLSSES